MPDATRKPVKHISDARDGVSTFILRPDSNDLFFRTGRQIIESCQLGISIEVWIRELKAMVQHVANWCEQNKGCVRSCYCAPNRGTVVFFVSPKSDRCDFKLADALTDLNTIIVRQFNVGEVEVRQIPWKEIDRFLCPESAELVYGEHFTSPQAMEA